MSYLVVSTVTPRLSSGTGLRTYGVVAALACHAPVELAYIEFDGNAPSAEFARLEQLTLRAMRASRGPARALAFARARATGIPDILARGVSPELLSAAADAAPEVRVIADGPVAAAALLRQARRRPTAYLAHNLESSGFRPPAMQAAYERFERDVLVTFVETWMATRAAAEGARRLVGAPISTRYVPNVIDVGAITPVAPAPNPTLLLVADYTYEPNRDAFEFLCDEVLPAVWRLRPEAELVAVGRGLEPAPRDHRIHTPGFVADLRPVYAAAAVALVPLLRGGGSPLKFIEALSYGLPVVATAHAASRLEYAVQGRDHLVARSPEEFAAAVESLLADRARAAALGAAGRELVVAHYSVQYLATVLAETGSGWDS